MANTNIQPLITLYTILAYITKYVSKLETKSKSYTDLQGLILLYTMKGNGCVPSRSARPSQQGRRRAQEIEDMMNHSK
jgi:hypothetical protein